MGMILRGKVAQVRSKSALLRFRYSTVLIMLAFWLGVTGANAQQPPGKPPQSPAASGASGEVKPLDNILLREADEDEIPDDLSSRVTLKYDHLSLSGGIENERLRVAGEEVLGPGNRFAIGYEIPFFIDEHGGPEDVSEQGIGDMKVEFAAVLSQSDRFTNGATAEFTFPSASHEALGDGQNVMKLAWSFSTPLSKQTLLNGILAYNKGLSAREGEQGFNSIEPEAVLVQGFGKRAAAFLDWDTYWDFNADQFGQTMKFGLEFQLDRASRWFLSPYAQFPLNHFTSSTNIKSDSGLDLTFRY